MMMLYRLPVQVWDGTITKCILMLPGLPLGQFIVYQVKDGDRIYFQDFSELYQILYYEQVNSSQEPIEPFGVDA
jgi:hypothetical protein